MNAKTPLVLITVIHVIVVPRIHQNKPGKEQFQTQYPYRGNKKLMFSTKSNMEIHFHVGNERNKLTTQV